MKKRINCDVGAGKKANDKISISYDSLLLYGITEIADMEIGFMIQDDDYNEIKTGPRQIQTNIVDQYDYQKLSYREAIVSDAIQNEYQYNVAYFSDKVLYEQNGISILSSIFMENKDEETAVALEVKNTSEQAIHVIAKRVSINGLIVYDGTWTSSTINADKTGILDINLNDILETNLWDIYGIEEVGSVEITLDFKDENWNEVMEETTVTIENPEVSSKFNSEGVEVYNVDGVRILMKDIIKEDEDYSEDLYILLLVENETDSSITLDDSYDSFSINGYMTDAMMSSITLESGSSAILEIEVFESDLEENSISDVSDISEIEVGMELEKNNGNEEEIVLTLTP